MRRLAVFLIALTFAATFCSLPARVSAAQLKKPRLAFSALVYANPRFWIAQDLKLFEKYGLDTELIYVSGSRPIRAMLGGSIDVSQVGGGASVTAIAQGAELAVLGTVFNRLTFAIHAAPQIKQISGLKGKTLASGSIGRQQLFCRASFSEKF